VKSVERMVGSVSPLGFTPLLSTASGQILKHDFRGLGPRVIDKSGNGHYGVLKPSYPSDAPRRKAIFPPNLAEGNYVCLKFDGENDYVRTNSSFLDGIKEFTVFWRSRHPPSPGGRQIIGMTRSLYNHDGFGIICQYGRKRVIVKTDAGSTNEPRIPLEFDNEWHSYATALKIEDGSVDLHVYKDGSLTGSYPNMLENSSHFVANRDLYLMRTAPGHDWYVEGDIEEVRIYDHFLSEKEAKNL